MSNQYTPVSLGLSSVVCTCAAKDMPFGRCCKAAASVPKDGTPFLAWYPKVRLDDDDNLTDEVIGGAWAIVSVKGAEWDEPEWLSVSGSYYLDDWCFAEMPTHWQQLPPDPSIAKATGES